MNVVVRQALRPARADCGGLDVVIETTPCVLCCSGAMWLPGERVLIAADLHLEKGSAFAARGQMPPPYDSRATLDRLEAEIERLRPRTVVLLGDSFHDRRSIGRMAPADRERLDRLARDREWIWLEGNHDIDALRGLGEDRLVGEVVGGLVIGSLRLVHEPAPGPQPGEVAGHLHPCARVAGHARSVRRPCFVTDGRRVVLPAFGVYTGGLNVLDRAFAALFAFPPVAAALGRDKVHALAWRRLL